MKTLSICNGHVNYLSPNFFVTAIVTILLCCVSCKKTAESEAVSDATATAAEASAARVSSKPNIILVFADDIGYEVPTVYGGQSYQTPNIDRMAQQGMRFTNCFSSPLCSPSRISLVTGKYNFRNYDEWGVLHTTEKTFGNLLKDAGYATYAAGKWQMDGGDTGIKQFGFAQYSVWNAVKNGEAPGSHYKNPKIFENGAYLPESYTDEKYGDDIFTNRVLNFIDANKSNPFFVYYPISLCHAPYCPTPADAAFASWDPKGNPSNLSFFPSMVKYMDAQIGLITDKLTALGISENTIIIFTSDNGTPSDFNSLYNGKWIKGGKSNTNKWGINVPMTILWPGTIAPGLVNDNLVDFTDFLPTFAELANTAVPASYGTTDGKSFAKQLTGQSYIPRDWVFNHYQPYTNSGNDKLKRWINNKTYKLYDNTGKFYNIAIDPDEKSPIAERKQTAEEKTIRKNFQTIMNGLK
jgi:arylsulfatase A